ncbi:lytic transglycosylase domain-containing protein [Anaerophilus nitritogenes]|uniref:lytic transglycosylase domain-containing protein n=1 Tax=Anaerophilus nitritogenes TaxID=2498136 RepID=UPI001FAA4BB9|nr:lytic transglycosylase domain-containing protein [Anaerophilus nitritogenes]
MLLIDISKYKKILKLIVIILVLVIGFYSIHAIFKIIYPIYYEDLILRYAKKYDLDPYLITAIIRTESKFDEKAKSHREAKGLMQIAPITGNWASKELKIDKYDETFLFIPEINIMMGCWYLNRLRSEFDGNLELMLAAYNGGSGNVNKWLKDIRYSKDGETLEDIPFPETKNYVKKVKRSYKIYKILYTK